MPQTETAIKERLIELEGEMVAIRYTRGTLHPFTAMVIGRVDGFVKRPREREKVRVQRLGETLIRCDVPLREIVSVEPREEWPRALPTLLTEGSAGSGD